MKPAKCARQGWLWNQTRFSAGVVCNLYNLNRDSTMRQEYVLMSWFEKPNDEFFKKTMMGFQKFCQYNKIPI